MPRLRSDRTIPISDGTWWSAECSVYRWRRVEWRYEDDEALDSMKLVWPGRLVGGRSVETGVLASWVMRRGDAWPEMKSVVLGRSRLSEEASRRSSALFSFGVAIFFNFFYKYVSYAEITPFHSRTSTVPRPMYLSQQFNFCSLMNDYTALVRKRDLNLPTYLVAMRKETVVVRGGDGILYLNTRKSRMGSPSSTGIPTSSVRLRIWVH